MKHRLDQFLVLRGLAGSREEAKRLIMAGQVRVVGGDPSGLKPGRMVDEAAGIELVGGKCPYVSRGGLKLAAALDRFGVDPTEMRALDVGASTGGFTDCLLQRGAARVVAVDTGRAKIHEKMRADPRVELIENFNARHASPGDFPGGGFDLVVVDVSFISLRLILPAMVGLLAPGGRVIALVKPQFEAGRRKIGSGGIVRDPAVRREVLLGLITHICAEGWRPLGAMASPILGGEGNAEFFLMLERTTTTTARNESEATAGNAGAADGAAASVTPNLDANFAAEAERALAEADSLRGD